MGKYKKIELIILSVLIVVLSGAVGYKVFLAKKDEPVQDKEVKKVSEEQPVTQPEPEPEPEPEPQPEPIEIPVNFDELKAQNPDVYAYIEIPGTQVSYPILQSADGSVDYLNTTLQRTAGLPGSIYTENISSQEFTDFNTVIYGHNMKDGSMFGSLHSFDNEQFFREHSEINVYMPDKAIKYHIYAARWFDDRYIPVSYPLETPEGRNQFLSDVRNIGLSPAYFNDEYMPTEQDCLITLSTCTSNPTNRLFIIGVRGETRPAAGAAGTEGEAAAEPEAAERKSPS